MAEDRRPDGPTDKTDEEDGERLKHADQRVGLGEEELAEDEPRHLAVKQEVVSLDRRADRAGDDGAAQLPAMLGVGKRADANFDRRHLGFPQRTFVCGDAGCTRAPRSQRVDQILFIVQPDSPQRRDKAASRSLRGDDRANLWSSWPDLVRAPTSSKRLRRVPERRGLRCCVPIDEMGTPAGTPRVYGS